MSLPWCEILAFQPTWYPLYLVNLVTKRHLVNMLFDLEIHNNDGRWHSQNINWKFLAISRTASLLVHDTKWDTFCKARTTFSKRIVKFSVRVEIEKLMLRGNCFWSLQVNSVDVEISCIQISPEGAGRWIVVDIQRCEASKYISTALHRPWGR